MTEPQLIRDRPSPREGERRGLPDGGFLVFRGGRWRDGERIGSARPIGRRFTRERLAEIKPTFLAPLVAGLFPRKGVAFIAGPSTSAKTFLAIEIGGRVSRGETVCGRVCKQAGVVYIAAEDAEGVRYRLAAWKQRNGEHGVFQLIPHAPNLQDPQDVAALVREIADAANEMDANGAPLGLVFIDTLSKSIPGADMNAPADMGAIVSTLEVVAKELGALVVVIAHTPKDESRGIAGWYGQFAAADAVIMCSRNESDPELRLAKVVKLKNGREGSQLAYRLDELEIGADEDGNPVTSCAISFEEPPLADARTKKTPKLSAPEKIALTALGRVLDHGETHLPPPLPGVRPNTRAASITDIRAQAFAIGFADDSTSRNTRNVRWNRTIEKLVAAERVRTADGLIWIV